MNFNKDIQVSLIIATYNWKEALELVLLSVLNQTMLPKEVIIADDGSKKDTTDLIERFRNKFKIPLVHVWHEDNGFRLAEIRNKAIKKAKGDYIIQIDGDVILHKKFIIDHVDNAKKGVFLVGSRVLLGEKVSKEILKSKKITFSFLSKDLTNRQYTLRIPFLSKILKSPTDDVEKVIRSVRGCNMSFWKSDLFKINGYDENMVGWGREDSELSARLINLGLEKNKIKFSGIQYHIYHLENSREGININDKILKETIDFNRISINNGIDKDYEYIKKHKITAIIPTFNEEKNIKEAIENVKFADEIIVIDSFSTDRTIDIAKKYNVKILQRVFDNFSSQKNFAIEKASNDWILMLDADERLSKLAIREILKTLNSNTQFDAFWMHRINYFLGKQIRFSGWQNDKVVKLFNRNKAKYNGKFVHEEITCEGEEKILKSHLLHYTYKSKGDYLIKMKLYSILKAKELFNKKIKPNLYHFKIKPAYRFLYHYIIKLGFLDGKKGKIIASINAKGVKMRYKELSKMYENSNS